MNLTKYTTENRNPQTMNLDQMTAREIISVMNEEDKKVAEAIEEHIDKIAQLAEWVAEAFYIGGRLIYIGAGTSGRLGVLDASECVPTFGVSPEQVVGIIAGGDKALRVAIEGAEDSLTEATESLQSLNLNEKDIVVGLAASGRTPYVIGGLDFANSVGCKTASVSCNKDSEIGKIVKLAIDVEVGPEILTGSTRLKSGTAQKLVLNMITTASMVLSGKAYENLMVDVKTSNEKLIVRAQNIVMEATGVSREVAIEYINLAENDVKSSIIMILTGLDLEQSKILLERNGGHVRASIKEKGEYNE